MFEIGEIVFCPLRGSGVIEAIERRTMLGETREYVIIQMKEPGLVIMIPTERIDQSGFRKVNNQEEADKVQAILYKKEVELDYSVDARQRTKQNQEKLSSGSFISCSEVVRDLTCMEYTKALSSIERTILMKAKRLLLDELSIIKHISLEEAECIVNRLLERE